MCKTIKEAYSKLQKLEEDLKRVEVGISKSTDPFVIELLQIRIDRLIHKIKKIKMEYFCD